MLAWLRSYIAFLIVPLVALSGMAGAIAYRIVQGQETSSLAAQEVSGKAQIPPIDAAQPAHTETATFAAG